MKALQKCPEQDAARFSVDRLSPARKYHCPAFPQDHPQKICAHLRNLQTRAVKNNPVGDRWYIRFYQNMVNHLLGTEDLITSPNRVNDRSMFID
mgnify:FL=1